MVVTVASGFEYFAMAVGVVPVVVVVLVQQMVVEEIFLILLFRWYLFVPFLFSRHISCLVTH